MMRPTADLAKLLKGIHATPRELAHMCGFKDEKIVQLMTLTFEIKRAERRLAAHAAHGPLRGSHLQVVR